MLHDFLILPEKKTKRTKTEREGFEPSVIRMYYNGFRVRLLRPLGHLSITAQNKKTRKPMRVFKAETKRIRTSDPQFRKLMLYPAELWSQNKKTEKGGFEPPDPGLAGQLLSREPDSASLAPLHRKKRRERDSNPRRLSPQQFSRLPPSTTRTSLQIIGCHQSRIE